MTGYQSKKKAARDKLDSMEREALKMALEALENGKRVRDGEGGTRYQPCLEDAAITAIKEALAQPAQELCGCAECGKKDADGWFLYCVECIGKVKEALAQPAQERQWIWLSDSDIAEVIDTTCQYTGGYEEYLIKKAERKIRSMNNG